MKPRMQMRTIGATFCGSLFAFRLKRLPLLAALLSELTLNDSGDNVTHLLKRHFRGNTTASRFRFPYSVSLLNFMSGTFVDYRRYRRMCGPRFASRGLMPANLEGFTPQANPGKSSCLNIIFKGYRVSLRLRQSFRASGAFSAL